MDNSTAAQKVAARTGSGRLTALTAWIDDVSRSRPCGKRRCPSTTRRRISTSGTTSARSRSFVLVIQIVTGIFLTMNYKPSAAEAFNSVEYIMRDVEWGWLIRYIHSTGASAFFIVVYLHMFRAMMYGSYQKPRELLWIFGMLIYLALMAEAFMGYLLPWGNMSYWGAQVIVSLFGAIPSSATSLIEWIRGDYYISDVDAEPLLRAARRRAAARARVPRRRAHHGAARSRLEQPRRRRDQEGEGAGRHAARRHPVPSVLHGQGPGRRRRVPDRRSAWSSSSRRTMGGYFLEHANFDPANSLQTPEHIAPVWYFTPYYAILRAVPNKLVGVGLMGVAVVLLFVFLPWLDSGKVQVDPLPRAGCSSSFAGRCSRSASSRSATWV